MTSPIGCEITAEPPAAAFFIAATDAKWIGDTHYGGI